MRLTDYQAGTAVTWIASGDKEKDKAHALAGLAEEVGEVMGVYKRYLRGDYTIHEARAKFAKEMDDALWYLARAATEFDLYLELIAEENLAMLRDRKARGVIKGSGDSR